MPINFQLLNAIQAPQVVGSVPGSAPNNSADTLAGGLMQGLQAGQQMQLNQKQGELLDQQISNAKGINEQRIKSQEALNKFGQEFNQNYDQAVKNLISRDPVAGMKMAQDYQDLKIKQGQAAQHIAEGQKAQMSTLHEIQITGGDMASTAMATATDPQTGQIDWNKANQVYQQLITPLKKQAPELADVFTPVLDEASALNAQKIGQEAMQQKLSYELKKAGTKDERTTEQKNLQRVGELNQKIKAGTATEAEKQEAIGLQSSQSKSLREEYTKLAKPFLDVSDAYGRIQASGREPTAAGDLALIFNYMKMLDPGSTVREGEFANAENSGSIPARIQAMYNKVARGERLSGEQREDFLARSSKLYDSQKESYSKIKTDYSKRAERAGIPVEDVIVDFEITSREQASSKDDLDRMADEAIKAGADPKAVQARLQELRNAKQ